MNVVSNDGALYTITIFATINQIELANKLSSLRFKVNQKDGGMYWEGEDGFFNIIPFRNQSNQLAKGYRIYTNYPISTIVYLMNGAFGWVESKVSGIEYQYPFKKKKMELIKEFLSHHSLKVIDSKGLFQHDNLNIIVLEDKTIFQRRGKIKKIGEELRKIEDIRDKLFPSSHDLFSFLEEGIVV